MYLQGILLSIKIYILSVYKRNIMQSSKYMYDFICMNEFNNDDDNIIMIMFSVCVCVCVCVCV